VTPPAGPFRKSTVRKSRRERTVSWFRGLERTRLLREQSCKYEEETEKDKELCVWPQSQRHTGIMSTDELVRDTARQRRAAEES